MLVAFLVVASVPVLTGAGHGDAARAEHQRITEFWTPERVAETVPRDFVLDIATGRLVPAKGKPPDTPGGGGGGGGGGGDDETPVVTGSSWKGGGEVDGAVGKALFSMGGSYYVCSATVIDDGASTGSGYALILTAAHCVYDEAAGEFAGNWMFVPDYDAAPAQLTTSGSFCTDTAYGCWTASPADPTSGMAVDSGYASAGGFNDQAVLYDFAVVRVGLGGHGGGSELDAVVAEQGYDFSAVAMDGSVSGYAFGYPAEKRYKGNDLIYCAGPVDGDPLNVEETYRLDGCKLNGGSSGGAWFSPFDEGSGSGTLISVNSYGYSGINAMHGPVLNEHTEQVYDAARAGGYTVTP
jgi:hypothetical protein